MRKILLSLLVVTGCTLGADPDGGGGGDDGVDPPLPDSGMQQQQPKVCALAETTADTGTLAAFKAQQCNVPGSQGQRKWYRVSATLPGQAMDYVQIDLWDAKGVFGTGAVAVGTYQLTGAELDPATCGVCVRALGDKGTGQKEYFATAGTVQVTSIGGNGAAVSLTLTNAQFREIDAAKAPVANGCTAAMTRTQLNGTIVAMGGGGGGGGGGQCPTGVGD